MAGAFSAPAIFICLVKIPFAGNAGDCKRKKSVYNKIIPGAIKQKTNKADPKSARRTFWEEWNMQSKNTKRSLLTSGFALLICCALLVGTTFA